MMKPLMAFPAAIAMAVAAAACSGGGGGGGNGGSGSGTVTGTFSGSPVTVRSAITSTIDVGGGETIQMIILTDASNLCATFAAGYQPKSAQGVIFQIANLSGTFQASAPTAPGTFHLFDTSAAPTETAVAMFEYRQADALCNVIAGASSTSGTITISAISGGTFIGSATLLTEDGDSISATFTAPHCAAMEAIITAPAEPPCEP